MKKNLKRFADLSKGLIALVIIIGAAPFIIVSVVWYCVKVWNIFF